MTLLSDQQLIECCERSPMLSIFSKKDDVEGKSLPIYRVSCPVCERFQKSISKNLAVSKWNNRIKSERSEKLMEIAE